MTLKIFSYFSLDTGEIHPRVFKTTAQDGFEKEVEINTPVGHALIEGHYDRMSKRVDLATKEVIDYQPPQPSADHEWNATAKRWALTEEAATRAARKSAAFGRIADLEANVQPRAIREVQLGQSDSLKRLQAIDDEIAGLRKDIGGK